MKIATTAQMQELDRIAIEERGIPSLALMERAAAHVTEAVLDIVQKAPHPVVNVVCGTGNNGGDGLACARQLMEKGVSVNLYRVGDPRHQTPDSRANAGRLTEMGGQIHPFEGAAFPRCDCLVDALFGVGLNREVGGAYRAAIEQINALGCPVVACDIPSGIHGDTGAVMGTAVRAERTITFSCAKPGLLTEPGRSCAGTVSVVDIGIPQDLLEQI
ncbi:MAG: NAD(P)H-hydrate epimerase [Faecalibacterium sp.]